MQQLWVKCAAVRAERIGPDPYHEAVKFTGIFSIKQSRELRVSPSAAYFTTLLLFICQFAI